MSVGAMMIDSYVDWLARNNAADGQGGYTMGFAAAVRLRGNIAPVIPGPNVSADQLDSRTRGTGCVIPAGNTPHEGDRIQGADGRLWEIKSVAPYSEPGMPVDAPSAMLLNCVEVQGQ